ncbi:MAG: RNA polymerase sigma factor [Mariniblastus sp.]
MSTDANQSSSDSNQNRHRVFATTSWSMVLDAADARSKNGQTLSANNRESQIREALSQLCQQYWYPLYAFVRRKGFERTQAEDLTQAFFTDLLEKNRLEKAEPARGRFRSFLLASLNNFIANHWRAESAEKRGGGQTVLSIDYEQADSRYRERGSMEVVSHEISAEKVFERNWALSILDQTLMAVGEQYDQSGKPELFEALKGFLTGDENLPYADVAQSLGMKEGAIKVAVHRMRQRYGQQLRLQIAKTIEDPDDVDNELQSLFAALE